MGESMRSSDTIGGSLVGNGLTSDVLRASVIEYYNNCHHHASHQDYQLNAIHKSGSVTQINGLVNGNKIHPKTDRSLCSTKSNPSILRPSPPHYKSERPHRTHSERGNKLHPLRNNLNHVAVENIHPKISPPKGLYRSNSSLNLDHSGDMLDERTGVLRRDYGSASSLDVISTTGESFFAMLREFRAENFDQRSPGPPKIQEYLRGNIEIPSNRVPVNPIMNGTPDIVEDSQSPKIKTKFQRLWEMKDKGKMKAKVLSNEPSLFKKLRGTKSDAAETSSKGSDNSLDIELRVEEKLRKKAFAHYDCQSVLTNLSYASRLRSLLSRRRNTTTGASAASMLNKTPASSTENLNPEETDSGDGRSNECLLSCPFFRNELGGEEERMISLSRLTCKKQKAAEDAFGIPPTLHKPNMAYGLSILERITGSRWQHRFCPYQRHPTCIEKMDCGATCYRHFFHGKEHQNWIGTDESLGPIAISIKREKIEYKLPSTSNGPFNNNNNGNGMTVQCHYQYRLIIRTSELSVMRGTVLEELVPTLARSNQRHCHAREVLEYVAPELQLSCLKLAIPGSQTEDQLMRLDEQGLTKNYKIGIMYCKAGQATEEEMYNNEHAGPAFEEFLDLIGQRVRLKSFEKYRGGLDTKSDTTGLYSVFTNFQDCEVMFHVSTLLPYTPNNKQQLLRKRHIGNDIVTIVFQEPDALPFTPKNIRSHFQHVFIIVRVMNPCTDNTCYRVAISRSKEVSVFGPPIPETAIFTKSKAFVDFLLTKVINAENAAHRSDKFVTMAQRTRQEYLKDLAANYCTHTTIDSGPKFSILSFAGRKKEKHRPRFIPDRYIAGGISWQIQVEDFGQSVLVDCLFAISVDTLVIIDEVSQETIFVCPCASILGWSSQTTSLKIFYHQGECLVLQAKDPDIDEIQEIVSRLVAVTEGCETQELILRRNSLGQLGFHVQFEGVVTEVENFGFAWQAGLRQGSRLVEICKVAVATLSYDQMVDLLKTSMTVSVTVIPPFPNGSPRKGCNLHNCSYLSGGSVGDYENISVCEHGESHHKTATPRQQTPFHSQRMTSRREIRSNIQQHTNRSPSTDQIHTKTEGKNFDSRGNHLQHCSLRNMPESLAAVFPCQLSSYTGINHLSSTEKQGSPLKTSFYPTPRTSPVNNNTHNHAPILNNVQGSHLHRSFHDHNRSSMNQRLTHVGAMVAARSELSLAEITPYHSRSHSHHLVACPLPSKASIDGINVAPNHIQANTPSSCSPSSTRQGTPFSKRSPSSMHSDYHSDSSSDWLLGGASSADELSSESRISSSPQSRNSDNPKTNSIPPSRKFHETTPSKLNRLRPGVTSPSNRPLKSNSNVAVLASSGSSCSGSTSTLQEDLFKLINPEFLDSDSNSEDPPNIIDSFAEASSRIAHISPSSVDCNKVHKLDQPLDIILKAQPAHVISSEPPSPAAAVDNRLERLSPRATADRIQTKLKPLPPPPPSTSPLIPLNENQDIEWPNVSIAGNKINDGMPISLPSWADSMKESLDLSSLARGQDLHNLEAKLHQMHQDLLKEQHQKASLEHQVHQLREENMRLQEESQSAAVQIRRYREWLLQNRDN